jgi:DNA-binding response OmpR family regulator
LDNHAILVRKVLNARGYEVLWANTGKKGMELAIEHPPGLILLDLDLPDIDGQPLVQYIRKAPELGDIPLVVISSWPDETANYMVTAYGCDGYIGKPIDIHLLSNTVSEFFQDAD